MASSSGMKRKALSINDKLEILKRYDEMYLTKNQTKIADEFGLPASTLRTILKNRTDIEQNAMKGTCKRQKVRMGKFDDLEIILLEWFYRARSSNLPINGNAITEKAKEIAEQLNISDFTGSNGWLDRFKNRHGIVYRRNNNEKEVAVDVDAIAAWNERILPGEGDEEEDCQPALSLASGFVCIRTLRMLISSMNDSAKILSDLDNIENFLTREASKNVKLKNE